jgi:hypothetical protein
MNLELRTLGAPLMRTAVALAAMTCAATTFAAPLPSFTLDPTAAGLNGPEFTANNLIVSDFSTVTLSGSTFSDTGYLAVSAVQNAGSTTTPGGLNSTYGLVFQFTGSGNATAADPTTAPTSGSFTSLTYTLYGYNGTASFDFDSSNMPTTTATGLVALGTGTLKSGNVATFPTGDGSTFTPSAAASFTFAAAAGESGFFVSPSPFYNLAMTAFTNTTSETEPFDGGFRIRQGGGSVNFTSAVPEPGTYALLLAGFGAIGLTVRRRSNGTQ